jgi:hypothetical protein
MESSATASARSDVPVHRLPEPESGEPATVKKLMPLLTIDGERYVMITPQLAGVSRKALSAAIGDFSGRRAEIIAALDFLLTGI